MVQAADGDIPRREAGAVVGSGTEQAGLFSVSDARHNQIRRLVTQAFTVKAANDLAPRVVAVTNALVDAMQRSGPPADLFEDYAIQTPMTVICEMLGIPLEHEHQFRQWAREMFKTTTPPKEMQAQMRQMVAYLLPLIEQERKQPGDNVLGMLVKALEQGDAVITQEEVLTFARSMIISGFETVSTTFTNSAFILLQRPDLLAQVQERLDDPARMATAMEEILRITPLGNGGRPRIARGDVVLSSTTIHPGEVLMLDFLSANRDEAVFPQPNDVNFDREVNPMITFGRGIHSCLGQQIAHMELRVLWTTLLIRLPKIRLAVPPQEVPWRSEDSATIGPAHLPVIWE
jgi:cytochrome P450